MVIFTEKFESMYCREKQMNGRGYLESLGGSIECAFESGCCNALKHATKVQEIFENVSDELDHSTFAHHGISSDKFEFLRNNSERFESTRFSYPPKAFAFYILVGMDEQLRKLGIEIVFSITATDGTTGAYKMCSELIPMYVDSVVESVK